MLKAWLIPKYRIVIFLALVNVAWMTIAWFRIERESWLWAIPIALSINFLLLSYDQILQFRALDSQPLIGSDPWGLLKIVHELSDELQVPMPRVFLIPNPSAQFFAYAKTRRHSRLLITEGALQLLSERQLRAALTYQMLSIRSSYNILNYWVAAWLDMIFRGGKLLERAIAFILGWTPSVASWIIKPWLWGLHVFLLGARDFQLLDRETVQLTGSPEDLAQAPVEDGGLCSNPALARTVDFRTYVHGQPPEIRWRFQLGTRPTPIERAH